MELHEIRKQEDLDHSLTKTMSRGWSEKYARAVTVTPPSVEGDQRWLVQPLLSAYFTKDVTSSPRKLMMDRFRFSPMAARAPLQWMLGTFLGSRPSLRLAPTGFWTSPAVPNAKDLLVVPGARRMRCFDFATHKARCFLKQDFDPSATLKEIAIRTGEDGPFPPIRASDPRGAWFEEDIFIGYPLPRCPPWWDRRAFEGKALELLSDWTKSTTTAVEVEQRTEPLVAELRASIDAIQERYPSSPIDLPASWLEVLAETVTPLGQMSVGRTHGDLQPGNIQVTSTGRQVIVMDWEHTDARFWAYDLITYGVKARYRKGLRDRLRAFIDSGAIGPAAPFLPEINSKTWRKGALAMFLLEELARGANETLSSPYVAPALTLQLVSRELRSFGESLGLLFRP